MLKLLFKYKWYILIIFVLIIADPAITSILNFWLQKIFNASNVGSDKIVVIRLLTTGFLLWMLKRIITFCSGVFKSRYICNAKQDLKHNLFLNLFNLDTSNINDSYSSGEYISVFTNDVILIEQRFFEQIISLISNIFSVLILGSSFFALNPILAFSILTFGTVSMFVPLLFSKRLNEKNLQYSNTISKFTQRLKEYLVAYPTIKNYSIEKIITDKFDINNNETENAKFESDYALNLANSIGSLISWFMQFIGVGIGAILVTKGEILIGTVVAAQSFAGDLALPLQSIVSNINSIKSVKEIVRKMELLSSNNTYKSAADLKCSKSLCNVIDNVPEKYDIEFKNLFLSINDNIIIDNFSFNFESGKKYLIVGVNGSGKSSLFKILKKWYKNCQGEVYINNQNIKSLKNEELSQKVSYLNENVSLFSGTVKENISLFRDYSEDSFQKAIDFVQMNLDLDRNIIDEGRNISSGEQRRIEIARSLLESVQVMIFDEVVSTLDIETAYEIEKLALGFDDKTIIFISHNFSGKLIKEYDEILVMDKGKLLAHGSYDYLINSCEYFKRICDIKFGQIVN